MAGNRANNFHTSSWCWSAPSYKRPSTCRQANFLEHIGLNERTQQTTLNQKRVGGVLVPIWCHGENDQAILETMGDRFGFGQKYFCLMGCLCFDVVVCFGVWW
jgi:hypothetical protein